ncbi:MAG: hypothetical protein ACJA2S_000310 [Cyclobacteriaceae bacterium]|jgi:hypothetical protein
MYRILFLILLFSFGLECKSQKLSHQSEIAVVTLGPNPVQIYTAFGHSGFRVVDPKLGIDKFYNYGVFDFDQPNFELNFARGKNLYKLGIEEYKDVKKRYTHLNQSITEQYLSFNLEQKQALFDFLQNNAKPENASYYYKYIADNCATRMRDVVNNVLEGKVLYDNNYASEELTYRQLIDLYLGNQEWGDLGIDICLGPQIDIKADVQGYMFLPGFVEAAFDKATISEGGDSISLIKKTEKVFEGTGIDGFRMPFSPFTLFIIIFLVIGFLTHRSIKYGVRNKWLDILLYGVTGIIGLLLLILWFGTDHLSAYNFNLIWAMPLNLVALIFLFKENRAPVWKFYYLGYGMILMLNIVFRELLPQHLHMALVPLALGLAIRSFYLYFDMRRKERGDRFIL